MAYKNYAPRKEHAFKTLGKDLREEKIKTPLIIYGDEQYLVSWAIDSILAKYIEPVCRQMDLTVIEQDDITCEAIINSCETLPMLSRKRVVLVKNFQKISGGTAKGFSADDEKKLIKYIKNMNESTMLIFSSEEVSEKSSIYKAVSDVGTVYEFGALDRKTLNGFIGKRLKTLDTNIDKAALSRFLNDCGYFQKNGQYKLYNLINDVNLMAAHCDDGVIKVEDVEAVVANSLENDVFAMLDAISRNRKEDAFQQLNLMIANGSNARYLTTVIAGQFESILAIKEEKTRGLSIAGIQKKLGMKEYRVKKLMPMTDRYSVKELKHILMQVYEIEENIYSGLLDETMAFEIFIAGM